MNLKAGYYYASPTDYKFIETKKGTPAITVDFLVEGQKVSWTGFLTEKTIKRTIESLAYMGFRGSSLDGFAYGPETKMLDFEKPVSITIAHETTTKGAIFAKVRWINPVRNRSTNEITDVSKIKQINAKAEIQAVFQSLGIHSAPQKEDDLPF